jgi:hypothetical protein
MLRKILKLLIILTFPINAIFAAGVCAARIILLKD